MALFASENRMLAWTGYQRGPWDATTVEGRRREEQVAIVSIAIVSRRREEQVASAPLGYPYPVPNPYPCP